MCVQVWKLHWCRNTTTSSRVFCFKSERASPDGHISWNAQVSWTPGMMMEIAKCFESWSMVLTCKLYIYHWKGFGGYYVAYIIYLVALKCPISK